MPHTLAFLEDVDAVDFAVMAAVSSFVISWISVVLSWRADKRAGAIERRTKQAELALTAGQMTGPGGRGGKWYVHPRVVVRNVGIGTARQVRVWLVDDNDERVSPIAGGELTLARGEKEVELAVEVDRDVIPPAEIRLLRWRTAWRDDDGEHEHTTDVRPI